VSIFLQDRLQERHVETRLQMERERLFGHVFAGAAEHEGIQQLIGDQLGRFMEVVCPPRRRDPVAQVRLEPGPM
jgi:hypothetical protein